jgi:hypothetical protein
VVRRCGKALHSTGYEAAAGPLATFIGEKNVLHLHIIDFGALPMVRGSLSMPVI